MASCEHWRLPTALVALLFGACGSRSGLEAPQPDAFVRSMDASTELDAGTEPDAGDDTSPIGVITITVTVGGDSLGDTDAFRTAVSEDFAFARFSDGEIVEVGLNEGMTWSAGTTHRRDIELASPRNWRDVSSVGIRHVAAGNDWNADNWTMAEVVIASSSELGRVSEHYREAGAPVWQFRKNDNQVWEHVF